ncbi:MAG: dienelactone hydrolase family protein [Ectothiorhodospiraceae bacterium]|nr:dienelactone hydrolase family protein [Ectothiorhodospiraceae bacterium]
MKPRVVLLALAFAIWIAPASAEIRTAPGHYTVDGQEMRGYLAYDASIEGRRPGVLVVHEWWGLNDYIRQRARMLAELGYTALAVDMYGEGRTADHPRDAGRMATQARENPGQTMARFIAADARLRNPHTVDGSRVAAIGYCFGGTVVLEMARRGADLKGVASFHGALATESPARPGAVQGEVLVLHGEQDPMVPPEQVEAFRREMDQAGVQYRFVGYESATHAFTNPDADRFGEAFDLPLAYDQEADEQSWDELARFLQRVARQENAD